MLPSPSAPTPLTSVAMSSGSPLHSWPVYQKTTLDNGLRVVTAAMPHTRSAAVGFFIEVGSRYEAEEEAGISHFVEHLLFKGTTKRPTAKEISETIEGVGGMLNGGTDRELTVFWTKVARPHFDLALDLLCDMLLDSKFDPDEVEKERKVIIEEIGMVMDSPQQRVDMLIDELLWPGQPLGREVAGSRQTVAQITRPQLVGHLGQYYRPERSVVVVAGDLEHQEVMAALARALSPWTRGEPAPSPGPPQAVSGPRLAVEYRRTEQAHLCLAAEGISYHHPDRYALDLLNTILGEGMSSRLFLEIRERRGLAYDIHSYVSHFVDAGSTIIYAGVDPKRIYDTVSAVVEELGRLREGIAEEEVVRAKELTKGRLLLRMEDTRAVAGWLGSQELLLGQIRTVDEVVDIVDGITRDDLLRVARQLLTEDRLRLAVVGPFRSQSRFERLVRG